MPSDLQPGSPQDGSRTDASPLVVVPPRRRATGATRFGSGRPRGRRC